MEIRNSDSRKLKRSKLQHKLDDKTVNDLKYKESNETETLRSHEKPKLRSKTPETTETHDNNTHPTPRKREKNDSETKQSRINNT